MTVEEIRIFIYAIANRDATGNSPTPEEYNSYLARANEELFNMGLRVEENGTITYDVGQVATDAYAPFLVDVPLTGVNGIFALPADYRHTVCVDRAGRPATMLTKNQFDQIVIDPITPPSDKYPYCMVLNNKINWAPPTNTTLFTYLRKPLVPVWGFTIINDEPIYDPSTSVQLEWPDWYHLLYCKLILAYLGFNFRDNDLVGYSQLMKKDKFNKGCYCAARDIKILEAESKGMPKYKAIEKYKNYNSPSEKLKIEARKLIG